LKKGGKDYNSREKQMMISQMIIPYLVLLQNDTNVVYQIRKREQLESIRNPFYRLKKEVIAKRG
jgi:hypothetical protein